MKTAIIILGVVIFVGFVATWFGWAQADGTERAWTKLLIAEMVCIVIYLICAWVVFRG